MNSRTRQRFWLKYARLPKEVQAAADRQYDLFKLRTSHPSIHFKPLRGLPHIWSARITRGYRAVGERRGDTITWFWIGPHHKYEQLLKNLR